LGFDVPLLGGSSITSDSLRKVYRYSLAIYIAALVPIT